jgi:hypothetical protein
MKGERPRLYERRAAQQIASATPRTSEPPFNRSNLPGPTALLAPLGNRAGVEFTCMAAIAAIDPERVAVPCIIADCIEAVAGHRATVMRSGHSDKNGTRTAKNKSVDLCRLPY